jgi:hypothetical protein
MSVRTSCHAAAGAALAVIAAVPAVDIGGAAAAPVPAQPTIEIVSSDAERVTGGDALVEVRLPRGAKASHLTVTAAGNDVTDAFIEIAPGVVRGLVAGLPDGAATLTARLTAAGGGTPPGRAASVGVVNHPIAGPVFSGEHQQPFYCETDAAGLGPSLDEECFAPTQVAYIYRTTAGALAPLADPSVVPADAAEVTVGGTTIPFVVRVERGVINRGIYEVAVLYDGADPSPTRDEAGWNEKVVMTFGGGCNVGYHQGSATAGVLIPDILARGYAIASNSLLVNETNCSPVVAAETAMMTKERLVEVYGPVTHTIGFGGSGGAIMQYTITHAYPGILDGLLPFASYTDAVSPISSEIADCALLHRYATSTTEGAALSIDQLRAISGHHLYGTCVAWVLSFANRTDATTGCPSIVPADTWYDPVTNPDGVRCALVDHLIKQIGADPVTGFARPIFDNTGIQYGLGALASGVITVDEFLDLNEHIGGYDADGVMQADRSVGDPVGIANAFASGVVTSGLGGLAVTPTIDLRPYLDFAGSDAVSDIHTSYWSIAMHERLVRDGVDPTLHSRWIYQIADNTTRALQALDVMDEWLAAIAADTAPGTDTERAARNRPAAAAPGCWTAPGAEKVADLDACYSGPFPYAGDLRTVAGAPITTDVICQRKAPNPADYPVELSAEQWARVQAIFRDGVCDYSLPGIGQVSIAGTWQSYS